MYLAALHGKVPTEYAKMEDFVTSNVFGFLKYADRARYLGPVLSRLGIKASPQELKEAEFEPWPLYDDSTEPDMILRVAGRYILFEAKWLSGFGQANDRHDEQVIRELRGGLAAATAEGLDFVFVAVTPDFQHETEVRCLIPDEYSGQVRWLRWGDIAALVAAELALEDAPDRLIAADFLAVMERYRLMPFRGFGHLPEGMAPVQIHLFYAGDE